MLLVLAACGGSADLDEAPAPLGDFKLVHNIVVAPKAQRGPLSRKASEEQLVETMRSAIAERFDRYDGSSRYHFGISVEGYVLAVPGVPVVLAPKSILIINLTVWDDAAGEKLNDEPKQITVAETFGTGALIGSGYTLDADAQLVQLSQNAAKAVERYLSTQQAEQGWFQPDEAVAAVEAGSAAAPVE
eukprot:CAMPEP_0184409550 /NCGR_PEP_ID=MMETSP0738-20130409/4177_1 /TAXON_ID=385413 /ORGANISM="Thalassiosira miniscula, Strain CCMP1093" /LENGTH=187 /DNA_ID=CAMNT_0026767297 /DNA_START=108 /DNA_END=671 /DNA_ORIENTATION=+